jgi:deoxyribodipyrimidine photo-lyase
MNTIAPYGIHWFRRDLRLRGNPAFRWNTQQHQGRVLGFFCFDQKFLARSDFSTNRFQFFLETLSALKTEMREIGGDLLVLDVSPDEAFGKLLATLETHRLPRPQHVTFNRDYEPFARERDARMEKRFIDEWGIEVHHERDHLLIEPDELHKDGPSREGYQVYTPFAKKWFSLFRTPDLLARVRSPDEWPKIKLEITWEQLLSKPEVLPDFLDHYRENNAKKVTVRIPPAGSAAATKQIREFVKRIEAYEVARDFPDRRGTSGLSIYLKNGSTTVAEIIAELGLAADAKKGKPTSRLKFVQELVWREFYYHILARHPYVEKAPFLRIYDNMRWDEDEVRFKAWREGLTGFPIVDAGMRQLKTTGWMHNRVRMIVGSFLCKDLILNWQWGEQYFMEHLLDGDLAPNNGGWQWAASTGCDPQPYFRIFNPLLQGQKFDPDGAYVKKYVPELAHLPAKRIHDPSPAERRGYPEPIVNHNEQREIILERYRNCRDSK